MLSEVSRLRSYQVEKQGAEPGLLAEVTGVPRCADLNTSFAEYLLAI